MTALTSIVLAAAIAVGTVLPTLEPTEASDASVGASLSDREDLVVEHFPTLNTATRFRDDWRNRRSGGRRHEGTDIYASKGSPIVAIADGVVRSMQSGGKGGYMLRIEHDDGWETWYMHLDNDSPGSDDGDAGENAAFAADLEVGDFVEAGDVVAFVGDSGNAETSEPHLHFELHHGGRKTNPYPHLAAAWERYVQSLAAVGSVS